MDDDVAADSMYSNRRRRVVVPVSAAEIHAAIADEHSIAILKMAYEGFKIHPYTYSKLDKKAFHARLRKFVAAGLVENAADTHHRYIVTSLGAIIVNEHLKAIDHLLEHFWHLKTIDMLKSRSDVSLIEKQRIIDKIMSDCKLTDIYAESHMTGFAMIRDYRDLAAEVNKLMRTAEKEVHLATRYYDANFSRLMFKRIAEDGIKVYMIDSMPEQYSVEKRLSAILRTPPDERTAKSIREILVSPNFDLRQHEIEASFMVVDGRTVCLEVANFSNPEEFTLAITHYNDKDLASQLIDRFNMIAKSAKVPEIILKARATK